MKAQKKQRQRVAIFAAALAVAFEAFGANAWMQQARKSPEWFTRGVMYQIQPRAFTPEGTLVAAKAKLPYLKDLGFTIGPLGWWISKVHAEKK